MKNIPMNSYEGYPYLPTNNSNLPTKQQHHPFYMNPLNNKINNPNWDGPEGAMDQTINQNSGMMSSIGPGPAGMKNSSNKLMMNQGQAPSSLYMNQMQQPNPMMTMNQNNGMMLNPQNPFPNTTPPNRNKPPLNGNQVMMNNAYNAPPQPPPSQNRNLANGGPITNNSSLLNTNGGGTDRPNPLRNDSNSPNEWNGSNGNMNNFMPLYYQEGGMNAPTNRPMKLMYNGVQTYPNANKPPNSTLNPGATINTNTNAPNTNNPTTVNPTAAGNSTNSGNGNGSGSGNGNANPSNTNPSNATNPTTDSTNIWNPPPFNNQNFYSMNNNFWNVFNNSSSNNLRSGIPLNTPMNDNNSNGKS